MWKTETPLPPQRPHISPEIEKWRGWCRCYKEAISVSVGSRPAVARCRCFPPGGSHPLVNLYACSRFEMVMQKDTKIYPGSGKRKPYVQRGRESLYYFAPKCLYRGEYKHGMECGGASCTTTYGWCDVLCCGVLRLCISSRSPLL